MTDERDPPGERGAPPKRTARTAPRPRRFRSIQGDSGRRETTPPRSGPTTFKLGNRAAAGHARPLATRNPIQAFDSTMKRVIDRLLYHTVVAEKDGKKYGKRAS